MSGGGGGDGETPAERMRHVLSQREAAIKRRLKRIAAQRDVVRRERTRSGVPVVALVG
jgi:GTP-binding protein HflX